MVDLVKNAFELICDTEFKNKIQVFGEKEFDVTIGAYDRPEEVYTGLSQKRYDMIVILPFVSGLHYDLVPELVSQIKKAYPHIKIVVLSGLTTPKFISDLNQSGIDGFFPMPFKVADLVQKIREILPDQTDIS